MLCLLADFLFESQGVNLQAIKQTTSYGFEKMPTLNYYDDWQATGKYEQQITLTGSLIKKSNSTLEKLERIANKKKSVTLAFENGRALQVVILNINTDKSYFLANGAHIKQGFEVSLGVINGEL